MDKEHVKGAADKAKGAIKDAAGKVMGDKEMQAEGKMDKAKGAAHSAVGDAKNAEKARHRQIARVALRVSRPPSGGFFFDEVGGGRRAKRSRLNRLAASTGHLHVAWKGESCRNA